MSKSGFGAAARPRNPQRSAEVSNPLLHFLTSGRTNWERYPKDHPEFFLNAHRKELVHIVVMRWQRPLRFHGKERILCCDKMN
jgi:hypothetical protein